MLFVFLYIFRVEFFVFCLFWRGYPWGGHLVYFALGYCFFRVPGCNIYFPGLSYLMFGGFDWFGSLKLEGT